MSEASLTFGAHRVPLKYISLVTLAVQNAVTVIFMKYSRTVAQGGPLYLTTTAVVMTEIAKLVACLIGVLYETKNIPNAIRHLHSEIIVKRVETMKMGIPSGLYTLQNNLLFVAVGNLDAATFQVTYQLKILTTALFSVFMLSKRLSQMKWIALTILMAGVALVQMQETKSSGKDSGNMVVGLMAVVTACFSSGFAGVYFEMQLKGSTASIFVRNIQLGVFGTIIGLIGAYVQDGAAIAKDGFFQGYNWTTWCVILLQAFGGVLVAVVVKYADNILKGFATSIAIILSCIAAMFLFDFQPSLSFLAGASLVLLAVYLYSMPDPPAPTQSNA
eukprot:Colp12_sorted_trinity150504_noHs@11644